jgi:hypothetical protein
MSGKLAIRSPRLATSTFCSAVKHHALDSDLYSLFWLSGACAKVKSGTKACGTKSCANFDVTDGTTGVGRHGQLKRRYSKITSLKKGSDDKPVPCVSSASETRKHRDHNKGECLVSSGKI